VRTLNLSWDEVHEEAENMEHAVSDLLVDRIDDFLGHPATDPHGDPIPKADGTIARTAHTRLSELSVDDRFRIDRVLEQTSEFLRYLTETGLSLGAEGKVVGVSVEAGVITVEVDTKQTTLSRSSAERLLVVQS
jgi:DtxR family Mn-dependent transcriptional regulator